MFTHNQGRLRNSCKMKQEIIGQKYLKISNSYLAIILNI